MPNLYRRPLHGGSPAWRRGVAASNNGFKRGHRALDIAAPRRTKVFSIRAGRVLERGYDSVRGHYLRIQHSRGVVALYQHLDERPRLSAGKRIIGLWRFIGYVGATGIATGPHLHFAISIHGVEVDPDPWLRKH
jgi:murein DD-endopeptidase MepM/ murein hydrolase activator NlpD